MMKSAPQLEASGNTAFLSGTASPDSDPLFSLKPSGLVAESGVHKVFTGSAKSSD